MRGRSLTAAGVCASSRCRRARSNDPPGGDGRMSIATGGSGGVYQVYGGGVAEMFSANGHRHDRRDDLAPPSTTCSSSPTATPTSPSPRRHGDRRRRGPGLVRRRAAAAARARHAVLELHARGRAQVERDHEDRGPQGQDGLDRRAELRHRGDRAAADGGRGARSRQGRDQALAGRGGVRRGAARGLDRRVRVVRRPADGRDHRPRDHRRDRAAAARRATCRSSTSATARRTWRPRSRRASTRASRRSRRSRSRTC